MLSMFHSKEDFINLKLNNTFFFLITSFLFVPNLLQIFSSDTQPWYLLILAFSLFISLLHHKHIAKLLPLFFLFITLYVLIRFSVNFNDTITKLFPSLFFIIFIIFLRESHIKFFLNRSFNVILFNCALGVSLYFLLPAVYEILYSGRPGLANNLSNFQLRSIQFCFPEPSYASKIFVLTGMSYILAFGKEKVQEARILFILSILTLSLTGFIMGFIALAYTLKLKNQIILVLFIFILSLMILNGYIKLPGRLYTFQILLQTLDFSLLLNDPSLQTRLSGLINMYEELKGFNLLGSEISTQSISFLLFSQFGFFGLIFLMFIAILTLFRLIFLDIFMVLIVLSIGYSDTFIFPPTVFFLALLARRTVEDIVKLTALFLLYRKPFQSI